MGEWKECKLSEAPFEIIDGDRGKNYPKKDEFFKYGFCLFLNTKNVTNNGFAFTELNFITKEKDELLRKGKLKRYDLVLTTRGTVGNVGYYNENIAFENIRINSGMVIIRPNGIDEKFNYQLFKYLKKDFGTFATGSAQPQLPIRDLKEMSFLLPPLPEQKAIASVLSSLDDKIDLLHRQNKTLEAMAETLFRQWFMEGEKSRSYLFNELVVSVSIKHKFASDKVIFLNTSDVYNGEVLHHEYTDVVGLPGQAKKSIQKDDILFTEIRPANRRFAYINFDADDYVVSTKLMVLRSKNILDTSILYLFLRRQETLDYLQMLAEARSGTFPQITFDHLKTLEIFIPKDEKILENVTNVFQVLIQKTFNNHFQIGTLEKLRNTLLPKLMSGEIKVGWA